MANEIYKLVGVGFTMQYLGVYLIINDIKVLLFRQK
jgi:hypothetical protein